MFIHTNHILHYHQNILINYHTLDKEDLHFLKYNLNFLNSTIPLLLGIFKFKDLGILKNKHTFINSHKYSFISLILYILSNYYKGILFLFLSYQNHIISNTLLLLKAFHIPLYKLNPPGMVYKEFLVFHLNNDRYQQDNYYNSKYLLVFKIKDTLQKSTHIIFNSLINQQEGLFNFLQYYLYISIFYHHYNNKNVYLKRKSK